MHIGGGGGVGIHREINGGDKKTRIRTPSSLSFTFHVTQSGGPGNATCSRSTDTEQRRRRSVSDKVQLILANVDTAVNELFMRVLRELRSLLRLTGQPLPRVPLPITRPECEIN